MINIIRKMILLWGRDLDQLNVKPRAIIGNGGFLLMRIEPASSWQIHDVVMVIWQLSSSYSGSGVYFCHQLSRKKISFEKESIIFPDKMGLSNWLIWLYVKVGRDDSSNKLPERGVASYGYILAWSFVALMAHAKKWNWLESQYDTLSAFTLDGLLQYFTQANWLKGP